jgi:hypothetical protein
VVGETSGVDQPLQIPPTRAPRRRRKWSRGTRIGAVVAAVVAVGLTSSALVDNEVSRRLATVPVSTTSSLLPTTTTVVPRPATPRHRHTEPVAVTVVEEPSTTVVTVAEVRPEAYDIIAKLDKLPVSDERTLGYARYRYGLWSDEDGDGCTTRDDLIVSQAVEAVRRTDPCRIVSGHWLSPYDNATIDNPDEVRVDHVVGLYEAWKSGAYKWTDAQRNAYLNDVKDKGAVLAVSRISAEDKDGRDPADWLPTNEAFRCDYLQTWVDLKTAWKLSVDAGERESIAGAALNC